METFLEPAPIILIHNGSIDFSNLKKARITVEYLFSELRMRNVSDIQTIKLALWEANGVVSIFRYPNMKQFRGLILKWREKISSFFCISKGWEDTERCSCIIRKNRSLGERISRGEYRSGIYYVSYSR